MRKPGLTRRGLVGLSGVAALTGALGAGPVGLLFYKVEVTHERRKLSP
jgi:hypothetical protein